MPEQIFYERIVNDAIELACRMMKCGAEVRNVEKTVERLCSAYGASECSVFAITSYMFATIHFRNHTVNASKRISGTMTSLDKLEAYNTLSRFICREKPHPEIIEARMAEIEKTNPPLPLHILGYIIGAGSLTSLVGGNISDFIVSAVIGIFVFLCDKYIKRRGINKLIYTILMCTAVGCLAMLAVHLGITAVSDKIIIGCIMLFIPTLSLCNSIKDMLYGDIFTGVYCFIDALLVTLMIALGFYIAELIAGASVSAVSTGGGNVFIRALTAVMSAAGFGIYFRIKPKRLPFAALGGLLAWGIYTAAEVSGIQIFFSSFIATAALVAYSEIMARILKAPANITLIPSIVPLLPGRLLYYTMQSVTEGRLADAYSFGVPVLQNLLGISVGILLAMFFCYKIIEIKYGRR